MKYIPMRLNVYDQEFHPSLPKRGPRWTTDFSPAQVDPDEETAYHLELLLSDKTHTTLVFN